VVLDGCDYAGLDEDGLTGLRRDRLGFVFQAFHVLPHLTVLQNVALPLWLQGVDNAAAEAPARQLLEAVGLGERAGSWPRELSGGEMQRVAIARALVHGPRLVLADEPTGNLDPANGARVLALLGERIRGAGAIGILVTHSLEAAATADRVLRLDARGCTDEAGAGFSGLAGQAAGGDAVLVHRDRAGGGAGHGGAGGARGGAGRVRAWHAHPVGAADLQLAGPRGGFDEALYARWRRARGGGGEPGDRDRGAGARH
jgi:putative ABC transport system ATP-binding protein